MIKDNLYFYFKYKNQILLILVIFDFFFLLAQFYVRSSVISSDFIHFYNSAKRLTQGGSVFFPGGDTLAFSSSLTYLFFAPLTLFKPLVASNVFICINYLLAMTLSYLVIKLCDKKVNSESMLIVFTLLIYSFPGRSIVSNGQIGFLVANVIILSLISYKKAKYSQVGVLLWVIFELKIYLAAPLCLFVLFDRKFKSMICFLSALVVGHIFLYIINPSSTIIYYFRLLVNRLSTIDTELDQIALQNLLINFGVPKLISWALAIISVIILITQFKQRVDKFSHPEIILALLPLCGVYFHRQDSILAVICIAMIVITTKLSNLIALPIVFLGNWGNSSFVIALACNILLLLVLILLKMKFRLLFFTLITTCFLQLIQTYIAANYSWQTTYILWAFLAYLFQILTLVTAMNLSKLRI